jgi:hypothetical protein
MKPYIAAALEVAGNIHEATGNAIDASAARDEAQELRAELHIVVPQKAVMPQEART